MQRQRATNRATSRTLDLSETQRGTIETEKRYKTEAPPLCVSLSCLCLPHPLEIKCEEKSISLQSPKELPLVCCSKSSLREAIRGPQGPRPAIGPLGGAPCCSCCSLGAPGGPRKGGTPGGPHMQTGGHGVSSGDPRRPKERRRRGGGGCKVSITGERTIPARRCNERCDHRDCSNKGK